MAADQPRLEEAIQLGKKRRDRKLLVESIIVVIMLGGFVFMVVESADWPVGASLFPRISGALGIVAVLGYGGQRLYQELRPEARGQGRLLDLAWTSFGGEEKNTTGRAITFILTTGGLWVGIWLVGFHIAVPAYLVFMLIVHGRVRWYLALATAIVLYGFILGVYDELLHTAWNDPLLFQMIRG